jgi:hypothetical protein
MNGTGREPERLPILIERARRRGFAGLVLDGVDVRASIAAARDPASLAQAIEIAARGSETVWAERLARRLYECAPNPNSYLELAAILVSTGHLDEAGIEIAKIPAARRDADERCRQVVGILYAKAGRTDEAMAIFDTLPGRLDGYHPAMAVLTVAQEMISQCDPARSMTLLQRLAEKYPAHLLIRSLVLRCHLYSGDLGKARELARLPDAELASASAYDRRAFVAAVAEIYELMGWMNELFEFTRDAIARDPTHWSLYAIASNAAALAARDVEYEATIAAIPAASRDSAEASAVMCRWHADADRIEQAAELLDALRAVAAPLYLNAALYLSIKRQDQPGIDAAFEACRRCGLSLSGPAIGYGLYAYYYNCSVDMLRLSRARLEPFLTSERMRAIFWQIYLRCLIGLGEEDKAAEYFYALPPGLANGAALKPFGMFFDQRAGRHEKARGDWMDYVRATRHACVNARSSYPRTLQLKYAGAPGAVLLFLTVFNGGEYLDWFLDHYRRLGVAHFFITDNGSDDGTATRLSAEPDVSLFANPDSFAKSAFGVLWTNHLMQRFGVGHWCFHVDMDEGFVFPGYDKGRSLRDLLAYCDDRGFGAVRALALDMYPESLEAVGAADPFAASCFFDVDYLTVPSELPPYVMIQGGLRRRLTSLASSLQKTPLVKLGADVRYIDCNHGTTHLPVADVSGALLHFKFVGDLRRRIGEAVSRGEHFGQSLSYQRLDHSLRQSGWKGSLRSSHSRRYEAPASLLEHGVMASSAAWDAWG